MEAYGFVYIWYNRKHKRWYVGSHWGTEDDGYICSSRWMRRAYRRRPTDFKRRIIAWVSTSRRDLLNEEQRWLEMIKPEELRIRYYNLMRRADHLWFADEDKLLTVSEKIAVSTKKAMARSDVRENYLNGLAKRDNRSSDPKVREKRRASMKATMAEKFPIKDRRVPMKMDSAEYSEFMRRHATELWQRPGHRESVGAKISEALAATKEQRSARMSTLIWFNDGARNVRVPECPGDGWQRGRAKVARDLRMARIRGSA